MAFRVASLSNATALTAPDGSFHPAFRQPRERDREHLRCIVRLPCIICATWPTEAAHIRFAVPEIGKPFTGMQEKPSDRWTTPLCAGCHRSATDSQHANNERVWWEARGIDPIALAQRLFARTGDLEAMLDIVNSSRPEELARNIRLEPLEGL